MLSQLFQLISWCPLSFKHNVWKSLKKSHFITVRAKWAVFIFDARIQFFFFQNSYFQGSYFLKIQIFLKFTFQFQFWRENSNGICFWNFSNTVLPYLMLIMMVMLVIMLVIDSTLLLIEWKCSSQRFPTSNTKRSGLGNSGR